MRGIHEIQAHLAYGHLRLSFYTGNGTVVSVYWLKPEKGLYSAVTPSI